MNRLKDTYRNRLENEGLNCDMTITFNGPKSLKDVPVKLFSMDFYHEGHARADDPTLRTTLGQVRSEKKKADNAMQGESAIFKKRW